MRRINGLDPALDLFGPGRHGFREQVPGVSPATGLNAKWFNAVQESIVRTIEAAGLQLSEADMDQFVAALEVLDNAARDAAVQAAAIDATNKANTATAAAALDATTKVATAVAAAAIDATNKANAVIPRGTRMLFQQTDAPVGWTKDVTHNDKALRVVSGAAGSGGAVDFSAAFVVGKTGDHTLTIAEMPAHRHTAARNGIAYVDYDDGNGAQVGDGESGSTGGGEAHSHPLDLNIKYVDIIIATKN